MSEGTLEVKSLITDRFDISAGVDAYGRLNDRDALGILLSYLRDVSLSDSKHRSIHLKSNETKPTSHKGSTVVAFLGAGNYASRVLMPAFRRAGSVLILSLPVLVSAVHHGRKMASEASTDVKEAPIPL